MSFVFLFTTLSPNSQQCHWFPTRVNSIREVSLTMSHSVRRSIAVFTSSVAVFIVFTRVSRHTCFPQPVVEQRVRAGVDPSCLSHLVDQIAGRDLLPMGDGERPAPGTPFHSEPTGGVDPNRIGQILTSVLSHHLPQNDKCVSQKACMGRREHNSFLLVHCQSDWGEDSS